MPVEQVTLRELLRDPHYKKWFTTPPVGGFPKYARWRVYAQPEQGRPWKRKDFDTFPSAFNFLAKHLRDWHDAALISRNTEQRPPIVRLNGKRQYLPSVTTLEGHRWCTYCRRPTVFAYYTKHHAFSGTNLNPMPDRKRCGVCGIAGESIKQYRGMVAAQ